MDFLLFVIFDLNVNKNIFGLSLLQILFFFLCFFPPSLRVTIGQTRPIIFISRLFCPPRQLEEGCVAGVPSSNIITTEFILNSYNVFLFAQFWHKHCKSFRQRQYNRQCRANPADQYSSQCSGAPSRRRGAPLHWQAY